MAKHHIKLLALLVASLTAGTTLAAVSAEEAKALGGAVLTNLVIEHTHTCYNGVRETLHTWGYGCGECPACALRKAGFEKWRSR